MPENRNRKRVNITLSPDVHERVKALVQRLPGGTVSAVIEESLESMLPMMEMAADAMLKHGKDTKEAREAFATEFVRTLIVDELEKEDVR